MNEWVDKWIYELMKIESTNGRIDEPINQEIKQWMDG